MLTITSPFLSITIPMADLTHVERSILAQLIGLSSTRKESFQALRSMPLFRKIRPEEVWASCPNKAHDFDTEVGVIMNDDTEEGYEVAEKFRNLMPDALVSPAIHRVSGLCPCCHVTHTVERQSVMVKTVVGGIPFSQLYAG